MTKKEELEQKKADILFKHYGSAFALINTIENNLERILYYNGNLKKLNKQIRNQILKGKGLGYKLDLAKSLIEDGELKGKIKELNKQRVLLAHYSFSIVEHCDFVKNTNRRYFALIKDEDRREIDEAFFREIIENASFINKKLCKIIDVNKQ